MPVSIVPKACPESYRRVQSLRSVQHAEDLERFKDSIVHDNTGVDEAVIIFRSLLESARFGQGHY